MNKISEKAVWDELVPSQDEKMSPASFGQPAQAQMMFCYKCNQVIPANSAFCPWCQTELFVTCPKCGIKYSSQYPACNQCGTHREKYLLDELTKFKESRQVNRQGLIILYYWLEEPTLVDSGYFDGVDYNVYMNQLRREGKGFDAIHFYDGRLCTDIGVKAHLNDGNYIFCAELSKYRKDYLPRRFFCMEYNKLINDSYHWKIHLTRWVEVKEKRNIFGTIKGYSYNPSWSATASLTDFAREKDKHNNYVSYFDVRSWMSKFGHVFWEDVRKYAKDLEAFLGMSPYDFFEYYKYYEYDK